MSADNIADANALFAFTQALGRVFDHLTPETSKALLLAIDQREDSPEKLHRFQAVEILMRIVYEDLYENYGHQGAYLAGSCMHSAQIRSQDVWRRLYGGPHFIDDRSSYAKMPGPTDDTLIDFVDDPELMAILGLQAGWTPDLKRIDPDLDLKATDLGGLS